MKPLILLSLFLLASCQTGVTISSVEIALTSAEHTALAYIIQPTCVADKPLVTCSDPDTVAKIKQADNVAFDAVQAAKTGGSSAAAAVAIAALIAIIPKAQ